ncbi:hypothetical protein F2Q69_00035069 [Brassica cretica]|uniref:Uncharacterized protein n=1 Tax=Brassica cretica TaxID=69181 RepID=A0A8S9SUQ2_BRACR|nr:hypothetical protein F2Q69_00035069 [Brassica cretica]
MEDMDFGRTSIDEMTTTSSDESTEQSIDATHQTSIDATHQTSIDDTPLEAGKFSLTNNANERVVLGEPKGQLSNTINQITNEQGTAIPVKINLISKRDHETKLPLHDYPKMIPRNPGHNQESETPHEKERTNTKEAAINLEEEEEELEEDVEIDRQEGTNVDRPTMVNINRQTGNNVDRPSTPAEPAVERVYRTLPPFLPNKTQTKRELDKVMCKKAFDKITLEMPLSDAIKVSPSTKKYVKDMVSNSFPAAEHSVMMVSEETYAQMTP